MSKRLFISLFALAFIMIPSAGAATFRRVTFKLADDSRLIVAAENLHIEYSDSQLKLSSPTVSETLPLETIKSMQFTDSQTALDQISAPGSEPITLYRPNGVKAGSFESLDRARRLLPPGVYLLTRNSLTIKLIF